MSDAHLRELERQWRQSGSDADEALFLLERIRQGELRQEQLELAAYLGNAAARAVGELPEPPRAMRPWTAGLQAWGKDVCVRVALAAARCVLPVYEHEHPDDRRPHAMCAAAEAWLRDPSPETLLSAYSLVADAENTPLTRARYGYAVIYLLRAVQAPVEATLARDLPLDRALRLHRELSEHGATVTLEPGPRRPDAPQSLLLSVSPMQEAYALKALRMHAGLSPAEAKRRYSGDPTFVQTVLAVMCAVDKVREEEGLTYEAVRAAIAAEVVPWALGYVDPVA